MLNLTAFDINTSDYDNSVNKTKLHEELCTNLHDTYIKKNSDYGDSFGKSYEKYGVVAAMVRMEDKWNRLENLIINHGGVVLVDNESIEDTLLDLANYAIMTCMELKVRNRNLKCKIILDDITDNTNDDKDIGSIPVDEAVSSVDDRSLG